MNTFSRSLQFLFVVFPIICLAPAAQAHEAELLSDLSQLTTEGRRSGEGYFSADGKRMVFQSEQDADNPFYSIYSLDLETGATQKLSPGVGRATCAWFHPDGQTTLFASSHLDPSAIAKQRQELEDRANGVKRPYAWDYDEFYDLFAVSAGGTPVQLTNGIGYDAEGSYSPDGAEILFASNRDAYSRSLTPDEQALLQRDPSAFIDLYIMNADGTNVRKLTDQMGYDGGPFFSADGSRITWRRFSADGRVAEIWSMNRDGSDQKQLTHLGVMSWAPYFHPSGDYLVFATNLHGHANFELYIVDAKGEREPVRVTDRNGFDGLPVFSPDGESLSWTSNRSANATTQIFLAKWNDRRARELLGLAPERPSFAATQPGVRTEDAQLHLNYLASPLLEGRMTGRPGERLATLYVHDFFSYLGLETTFQEFSFVSEVRVASGNHLTPSSGAHWEQGRDWRPIGFSASATVAATDIVFAGYGIQAPAEGAFTEYNSYQQMDPELVRGKWVLVFRYLPEGLAPEQKMRLARYSTLEYKAAVARDFGALGLIVVSGPNAKAREELVPLRMGAGAAGDFVALSVKDTVAESLLTPSGFTLSALQDPLDRGEWLRPFVLPSMKLSAQVALTTVRAHGRNVVARLSAGRPGAPTVVIGAHIDHLGYGETGTSLGNSDGAHSHPGADDNASGVSALLEIAQSLVHQARVPGGVAFQKDIVFVAWSGEELGTRGSQHFVSELKKEAGADSIYPSVAAYLNLDMVGRLREKLFLQGLGSSLAWPALVDPAIVTSGLTVEKQSDPYLPTDSTPFYLAGVPVIAAFTGTHAEYHTPSDTLETLNVPGIARIAALMGDILGAIATRDSVPDYQKVARTDPGNRIGFRAVLGLMPDYAAEGIKGLRILGARPGSPADQAGLKEGDVIVKLAGKKIENIHDYMFALNIVKIRQPNELVILRDGQELVLSVVPEAKE